MDSLTTGNIVIGKWLAETKITRADIAEQMGISEKSLYNKLHGRKEFTEKELVDFGRISGIKIVIQKGNMKISKNK